MRKVLAVVFAAALVGMLALNANAQTPNVQVCFDPLFHETQAFCPGPGMGSLDTLYVVCHNFDILMQALEFQITYPAELPWIADKPQGQYSTPLVIGDSPTGIALSWPVREDATRDECPLQVIVQWNCTDCSTSNIPIVVGPNPQSGQLRAIEWQTYRVVPGIGMTSLICPTVAVQESTWGKIKAQYNN